MKNFISKEVNKLKNEEIYKSLRLNFLNEFLLEMDLFSQQKINISMLKK